MQVLTVDVGTGTQDIYLFRPGLSLENGFKLVMPSPTMLVRRRIQEATRRGEPILLKGVTMGGGPCHWAAEAHLRAGFRVYATPEAARTFNDDLEWVRSEMGVEIVGEDEALSLKGVRRLEFRDLDYGAIQTAFSAFGIELRPQAIAVAVFDHGAAPPQVSDRQFRFDYLKQRVLSQNRLSAFAYLSGHIPASLTRMLAVVDTAGGLDCPLVVMDTAPAAVQGALLDPRLAQQPRLLVANVGNFHTIAFRLGPSGIEGLFEHHTGLLDLPRLESLLEALADGSLTNQTVFGDNGHGAIIFHSEPLDIYHSDFGVAVTGPRRAMMAPSRLRPWFAVPFGDMMIAGCFGLLVAVADLVADVAEPIRQSLRGQGLVKSPWDAGTE